MATLKDVAREAGVTVTTVSRVLNNRGYISDATRKKVYQSMEKLNYHPNEVARSLSQKHTNCIGVIVPSVRHPFFSEVVSFLEYHAFERGYKVMLCNSYHQKEKEKEYLGMLQSNKVSGIVLCSRTAGVEEILKTNLPVVTFERMVSPEICAVSCDNLQGGYLAAAHLVERGCKKLMHIGGVSQLHLPADDRQTAFEQVCRQHNIPFEVLYTQESQFQAMDYGGFLEEALERHPDVDGVFASNDIIAAQLIQACAKRSIRVPEDLKIVGYDDIRLASLTTPAITTVRQPVNEMCEKAVESIIQQLDQKYPPSRTTLGVTLVRRETT